MLDDAALPPGTQRRSAVERAWTNLTGVGPLLTAAERQQVIRDARAAWAGASSPNAASSVAGEATHWLAVDAEGLRADIVASFEARGLDRLRYLEIVGVVARLANVDFYATGLGASLPELSPPAGDPPTGLVHPDARQSDTWVPSVGKPYAPLVLDALPTEGEALRDLHEPMYIELAEIADGTYGDELTRPQIEYLAARISYFNECFY